MVKFSGGKNYLKLLSKDYMTGKKRDIQDFWGQTSLEWYNRYDHELDQYKLDEYLRDLTGMFKYRKHLAVTEMDLTKIKGKKVLEVGSGGGAHSALFKKHGASVTSIDITEERVMSTAHKLSMVPEGNGMAIQADAENIPFKDGSFDIVYSNGVLHHSENTDACINEVYRVLKAGGQAVIMLYCKDSFQYWLNLMPRAIMSGLLFKYPAHECFGLITEGRPRSGKRNPVTRIYSKREIIKAFGRFSSISLRKSSFFLTDFLCGDRLRSYMIKLIRQRPYKSGILVYGEPFYAQSRLEVKLGPVFGFAWNITVTK